MRKCLLIAVIALCAFRNTATAQVSGSLFEAPDTVCINQPVKLIPNDSSASTYYWNFCSGFLANNPVTRDLGNTHNFDNPQAIEVAQEGSNYYGFVASRNNNKIYRLDYGTDLSDTPVVSELLLVDPTVVPQQVSTLYILQDSGRWYLFVAGGTNPANSTLSRIDFGTTLANPAPVGVKFGNPGNLLNNPRGLFVSRSTNDGRYYGFVVNGLNNTLTRLSFGPQISLSPLAQDLGNIGAMNGPNDIAAIQDGGKWYFLVPNIANNTLTRITFDSLNQPGAPVGLNMGTLGGRLFAPSSATIVRDCGIAYGFITNRTSSELVRVNMPDIASPTPYTATNLGALGGNFSNPTGISNVVRKRDSLFAFVVNATTGSLTQVLFPQCTNATIASSNQLNPPVYEYHTPGLYNVVLHVNEGRPDARIECKQIRALPIPAMTLTPQYPALDYDTMLCQSDSIYLLAQVSGALSYTWSPNLFIFDSSSFRTLVAPEYTITYNLTIPFANGCIIDTAIRIMVSKNKADAGYDRTITDGATTTLGGPNTTLNFTPVGTNPNNPVADTLSYYNWTPAQYLNDPRVPFPVANPAHDMTYYLTVRNTAGCVDTDTVVVRVVCEELHLPNAFSPDSRSTSGSARFGLLNRQIVKLNYFRIFDRWGREVFSTTDPTKEWDGTINGEPAPYGVYVWTADGFCSEGKKLNRSGNVTLLR